MATKRKSNVGALGFDDPKGPLSAKERADERWGDGYEGNDRPDRALNDRGSSVARALGELSSDSRYIRQSLERLEADTKAAAKAAQEASVAIARLEGSVQAGQAKVEGKVSAIETNVANGFGAIDKERKQLRWFIGISLTVAGVVLSAVMLWISVFRDDPIEQAPSAAPAAETEGRSDARGALNEPGQRHPGASATEGPPTSAPPD